MIEALFPLAIDFSELVNPQVLTEELSIIIVGFMLIVPFIGVRLRSPIVFFFWAISLLILIVTFVTALQFIWFWFMMILSGIVIAISAMIYYL